MVELYWVLLICGLLFVGAEVFVPGGILGSLGALALVAAVLTGFAAFGPTMGGYLAAAVIVLVGISVLLWIKLFPRSRLGQKMTVTQDLREAKATPEGGADLIGKEGVAASHLRPAGFAMIEGRRVDVVTEGLMVRRNERVRVVRVEGNRVVVAPVKS